LELKRKAFKTGKPGRRYGESDQKEAGYLHSLLPPKFWGNLDDSPSCVNGSIMDFYKSCIRRYGSGSDLFNAIVEAGFNPPHLHVVQVKQCCACLLFLKHFNIQVLC